MRAAVHLPQWHRKCRRACTHCCCFWTVHTRWCTMLQICAGVALTECSYASWACAAPCIALWGLYKQRHLQAGFQKGCSIVNPSELPKKYLNAGFEVVWSRCTSGVLWKDNGGCLADFCRCAALFILQLKMPSNNSASLCFVIMLCYQSASRLLFPHHVEMGPSTGLAVSMTWPCMSGV